MAAQILKSRGDHSHPYLPYDLYTFDFRWMGRSRKGLTENIKNC